MTSKSEIVQAVIQICYPTAQLYVGKVMHVSQSEVFVYIIYWLTLIAFKLWFGYRYIVFPVTVPSLELFDDYMNYEEVKFVRTATLMFAWWFPHFMVYIIDLSIWYSVWSSMVGGFVALYERQGTHSLTHSHSITHSLTHSLTHRRGAKYGPNKGKFHEVAASVV